MFKVGDLVCWRGDDTPGIIISKEVDKKNFWKHPNGEIYEVLWIEDEIVWRHDAHFLYKISKKKEDKNA